MIISEAGHLYMFVGQMKYFCLHCLLNYFPINTLSIYLSLRGVANISFKFVFWFFTLSTTA